MEIQTQYSELQAASRQDNQCILPGNSTLISIGCGAFEKGKGASWATRAVLSYMYTDHHS